MKLEQGLLAAVEVVYRQLKEKTKMEEVLLWRTTRILQGDASVAYLMFNNTTLAHYFGVYPEITSSMVSLCIKRVTMHAIDRIEDWVELLDRAQPRSLKELETEWFHLGVKIPKGLARRAQSELNQKAFKVDLHWRVYQELKKINEIQSFVPYPLQLPYRRRRQGNPMFTIDLLIQLTDGKVGLVMIRSIEEMATRHVRTMYTALQYFCQIHGCFVTMVDDQLLSMKRIHGEPIMNEIVDTFDDMFQTARMFNSYGMKYLQTTLAHHPPEEITSMVYRYLIQNHWALYHDEGWYLDSWSKFHERFIVEELKQLSEFTKKAN